MTIAPRVVRALLVAVSGLALLTLAGCAKPSVILVSHGATYTIGQVEDEALGRQPGKLASLPATEAPARRQEVLTELRRMGPDGVQAADFLTKVFPVKTKAVPLYVEKATVDGKPAWILVEAWSDRAGRLARTRLWVLERSSGNVIVAIVLR